METDIVICVSEGDKFELERFSRYGGVEKIYFYVCSLSSLGKYSSESYATISIDGIVNDMPKNETILLSSRKYSKSEIIPGVELGIDLIHVSKSYAYLSDQVIYSLKLSFNDDDYKICLSPSIMENSLNYVLHEENGY